jgi:hypothetical protein
MSQSIFYREIIDICLEKDKKAHIIQMGVRKYVVSSAWYRIMSNKRACDIVLVECSEPTARDTVN